jgi:hypothetical protein
MVKLSRASSLPDQEDASKEIGSVYYFKCTPGQGVRALSIARAREEIPWQEIFDATERVAGDTG